MQGVTVSSKPWRIDAGAIARFCAAALVVLATLYPRVALWGGFPATDEGVYALAALFMHDSLAAGMGLPDYGVLHLYPALLAWVFSLDWNHLLLLRAVDMLAALCAGWLLFRVAAQESGSWVAGALIAAAFSFAANQQAIVQHGFKNAMFAAYVPLFLAARVGLDRTRSDDFRWYLCGGLVAIAVLLRETFVPFAALGTVAVLVAHGWKNCVRYVGSGIATALVLGGAILLLRGGVASLVTAYVGSADVYQTMAEEWWQYFARAVEVMWRESGFVVPLVLGARAAIAWTGIRGQLAEPLRLAFWAGAATIPLLEPIAKIGYPYHVAVCLPGLCGLCAFGWRLLGGLSLANRRVLSVVIVIPTLIMAWPQFGKLDHAFRSRAIPDVSAIREPEWPRSAIEKSNYLLLADAIRRSAPSSRATLSSSVSMVVLLPLTGLLPPAYGFEDLSEAAIQVGEDATSLRAAIRECPPDMIMLAIREGASPTLAEALAGMPEYTEVAKVPPAKDKDYGAFGGKVYRRSGMPGACQRVP